MARKDIIKHYRPVLDPDVREPLFALAEHLGFIVSQPGTYHGQASVSNFLYALAEAYRRDPPGVKQMMKLLGVTPDGKPLITIGDSDSP